MELVRIFEIQDCKMVSSGIGNFREGKFDRFEKWFSSLPRTMYPMNFLFCVDEGKEPHRYHWLHMLEENMDVPKEFEIIDFKGGLYAVVTIIDQGDFTEALKARDRFLEDHGLEIDKSLPELSTIFTTPLAEKLLGYNQMDCYTPIKSKV